MPQATPASIPQNLSIQQAANAIVALVNSSPRSPWPSEIEAIVARIGSPGPAAMSPVHAEHYREWRNLIAAHMRKFGKPDHTGMTEAEMEADDARMSAHMRIVDALTARIFAVPARTWGDVMLYAQACFWQYWAGFDPEGPEAQSQLEGGPHSDDHGKALVKLIEAIFTVAGIGQFAEVRS